MIKNSGVSCIASQHAHGFGYERLAATMNHKEYADET